ncbi:MAG TPA: zinc ribbon domain-containing protein [Chthoniobacterales bacterium]|nr:zinc ribbon domain-containing protein [Chthoniobacterales bacterium]
MNANDISSVLASCAITPAPHSPLRGLSARTRRAGFPKKPSSQIQRALTILANPRWELGIIHSQPWQDEPRWFYAAESDPLTCVAWNKGGTGANQDVKLIALSEHEKFLGNMLCLDAPAETSLLRLQVSPAGCSAFLACIDGVRRAALISLMEHQLPPPEVRLVLKSIGRRFAETLACDDFRWLSAMFARVSPVSLPDDPAALESGMKELVTARLLDPVDADEWRPTPVFFLVCEMLAVPLACVGISRSDLSGGDVPQPHLALLRAPGSVWIIEFTGDEQVRIRDGTCADAELALSLRLATQAPPRAARKQSPAVSRPGRVATSITRRVRRAEAPPPATKTCRKCKAPLKPSAKFCKHCGTPVA